MEQNAIWLVALIGLTLSLAALWLIRQQLEAHRLLDFEWVAHNRTRALNHGIDNGLSAIESVRDFFLASSEVDANSFQTFAESLLKRVQGVHALMWVPRRPGSEREESPGKGDAGMALSRGELRRAYGSHTFPVTYSSPTGIAGFSKGTIWGLFPGF